MPTNYQNAKIYSIRSRSRPDLIYIGSTTQGLAKRFSCHNSHFRNNRLICSSKRVIEIGDAYIELIEPYACANRNELERREGEIIRSMDCVNNQIPGRTIQEYREDNKEHIKQYREEHKEQSQQYGKQHYIDNKEEINRKHTQHYLDNKEHTDRKHQEYYENNKERCDEYRKQWRVDNKEHIKQQVKQWSENNKEHCKEQSKQYHEKTKDNRNCICGGNYNYGKSQNRKAHYNSKHHTNFVSSFFN